MDEGFRFGIISRPTNAFLRQVCEEVSEAVKLGLKRQRIDVFARQVPAGCTLGAQDARKSGSRPLMFYGDCESDEGSESDEEGDSYGVKK